MATILPFLLLSAIFTKEAQQGESIVNLGSSLTPTSKSSWLSRFGIPEKTVVWTANRDKPPALASVTLNFTSDGRLIMQLAQGEEMAIAIPPEHATLASMLGEVTAHIVVGIDFEIKSTMLLGLTRMVLSKTDNSLAK
ncbi:hypothetical protein CFP56_013784 [Quercus suber]|uniref:Uncharacterized protein n=1 Tax=Quercus suber TaxID=58331 RepID=A0AAW0M3J1_QUESU